MAQIGIGANTLGFKSGQLLHDEGVGIGQGWREIKRIRPRKYMKPGRHLLKGAVALDALALHVGDDVVDDVYAGAADGLEGEVNHFSEI